jgi:transcriptional regulator with XRE-family HTH domain
MARQLKLFLAEQIRALRGELTQKQFGDKIGKPQSVVSRLEKEADRQISVQTLIDIAKPLDIAVIIRFVDYPAFLRYTEDYSDTAIAPRPYDQNAVDALADEEQRRAREHRAWVVDSPPSGLVHRNDNTPPTGSRSTKLPTAGAVLSFSA